MCATVSIKDTTKNMQRVCIGMGAPFANDSQALHHYYAFIHITRCSAVSVFADCRNMQGLNTLQL